MTTVRSRRAGSASAAARRAASACPRSTMVMADTLAAPAPTVDPTVTFADIGPPMACRPKEVQIPEKGPCAIALPHPGGDVRVTGRRNGAAMCRWIAYRGETIPLEQYVTAPAHSLVVQSLRALESTASTNGDGFGMG